MKKITRLFVICNLVFLMISGTVITTYASTSSNWQYCTTNGYSYQYRSSLWNRYFTSGNTIEAVAEVMSSSGNSIPVGYMGTQARLFTSGGLLKYASSTIYNNTATMNLYAYSPRTTSSGYFYSQTAASFYNGNGYTVHIANSSPNGSINALSSYEINANNEMYGSGLLASDIGHDPDLISAIGTKGEKGYVRADDLFIIPDTVDDAIKVSKQAFSSRIISLYNINDEVIGEFLVDAMNKQELVQISENSEIYLPKE